MDKLNLDKLKVESFVTSFSKDNQQTVRGGRVLVHGTGGQCTNQCNPGGDTAECYPEPTEDRCNSSVCGIDSHNCLGDPGRPLQTDVFGPKCEYSGPLP